MHLFSCTNTHRDVTDLVNPGMVKNTKTRISWERNIIFLRNRIDRWHILKSYCFVAEVTLTRTLSFIDYARSICSVVLKWKQRFNVSSWLQNYKHYSASSKAFNSIYKPFNIMLIARTISNLNKTLLRSSNCQSGIIGWFLSFFLKSLITNLLKLIGYPASKYFLAMIETSASNQKQF